MRLEKHSQAGPDPCVGEDTPDSTSAKTFWEKMRG